MLTRRKATITLYHGDDLDELQRLRVAVADAIEAEDNSTASLADTSAEDARVAYNEFRNGPARERAVDVVLQALRWDVWDALEAEHPARKVEQTEGEETRQVPHPEDRDFDVNTKTLPQALVPVSIVEPEDFDPAELSKPDYMRLFFAALALNRQAADPKEISPFESVPENDDE